MSPSAASCRAMLDLLPVSLHRYLGVHHSWGASPGRTSCPDLDAACRPVHRLRIDRAGLARLALAGRVRAAGARHAVLGASLAAADGEEEGRRDRLQVGAQDGDLAAAAAVAGLADRAAVARPAVLAAAAAGEVAPLAARAELAAAVAPVGGDRDGAEIADGHRAVGGFDGDRGAAAAAAGGRHAAAIAAPVRAGPAVAGPDRAVRGADLTARRAGGPHIAPEHQVAVLAFHIDRAAAPSGGAFADGAAVAAVGSSVAAVAGRAPPGGWVAAALG